MASFTLDDIRAAAEAKYGATIIDFGTETVELRNPLRLPQDDRKALMEIQGKFEDEDADQETLIADALVLVAADADAARRLVDTIGGDLAVLVEVFQRYIEGSQVGEASASHS